MPNKPSQKPRLTIRNAQVKDIPAIQALIAKVYTDIPGYTRGMLRGQLNQFPEGVFLAEFEGRVVGYCVTFRIGGDVALKPTPAPRSPVTASPRATIPRATTSTAWRCASTRTCAASAPRAA